MDFRSLKNIVLYPLGMPLCRQNQDAGTKLLWAQLPGWLAGNLMYTTL